MVEKKTPAETRKKVSHLLGGRMAFLVSVDMIFYIRVCFVEFIRYGYIYK